MKSPAVSVIIPVWNGGKYFRECLDSVLAQTLRDIEVLIVDDASTDGSGSVAEEYAARDARITVLHQKESMGAGPARNAAMAMAKGQYIAFMDSDDLYPSDKVLETLYHKAVEQDANICGGSLYKIDADGAILNMNIPYQFFTEERWYQYQDYQYDGGFYRFLYRRVFINKYNLRFPAYKRFQDPVFFVNAMIYSGKFYVIPGWVYAYRKEHKFIIWDTKSICDHLHGVCNILDISNKYKLNKLHCIMLKNIYITITKRAKKHINLYVIKNIFYTILHINFIIWIKYVYKKYKYF